ncbi:DoxX family protein [Chitinophaga sp. Cy-1792]|uniref:DoxX family protein n=1 Tax=Chitinophaga sp. Cy-1792 TaxID=2608339 RepID=UPI00141EE5D3|nr:DoxX family protein [Chitinophaga sp. Cy-1792]NIG55591.1 DoxX family protein [Chitinophaga sp. Cy-1792]
MKLTYRITNWLFIGLMLVTSYTDFTRMAFVADMIRHLGYPGYLPLLVGTGKITGAVILAVPGSFRLKEWPYAGFSVLFIGAAASHALAGDDAGKIAGPLCMEALLLVSYIAFRKTYKLS